MDDTSLARTLEMPTRKPYKPTQAHGQHYIVRPVGRFFEVRRVYFERGRILQDQLVTAFPSEQDADDAARMLAELGE